MGQLAVKFKLWWEKLEASKEKSKDGNYGMLCELCSNSFNSLKTVKFI